MSKLVYESLDESMRARTIDDLRGVDFKDTKYNIQYTDFFKDLLNVGESKALGYLPLRSIREHGGKKARDLLVKWAEAEGLEWEELYDSTSGALYIWDEEMLAAMLEEYKEELGAAGVDMSSPKNYVRYIDSNTVYSEKYPEAYRAIGKTFNDKRWRDEK